MKKALKSLLFTLLVAAMLLNTCGIVLAADATTFSVTEAVVDEATGVRKLVFSVSPASTVTFLSAGAVFSYDNTVIQPVNPTTGAAITVAEGVGNINDVKAITGSMAGLKWTIKDNRTGVSMALMAYPAANLSAETGLFEFHYKVKEGKSANSETFKLETDYSDGSILKTLYPTASTAATIQLDSVKYGTPADDVEAIESVSISYEGDDVMVLKELAITASAESVNVPTVYPAQAAATVTFTAAGTSTIDTPMAVPASAVWSVEGELPAGVTFDAAAKKLTVAPGAAAGTVTVKIADGNVNDTVEVAINRAEAVVAEIEVKANGNAITDNAVTLVKPATAATENKEIAFTTKVYDQYGGEVATDATFALADGTSNLGLVDGNKVVATYETTEGYLDLDVTYGEFTKTIRVNVVGLAVNWNEVTVASEITYGATNESAVTLPANGAGTATVDGETVNGIYSVVTGTAVQNAGAGTITVKFTANADEGDYANIEITKVYNVTINKAATAITAEAAQTVAYTGAAVVPVATVDNTDSQLTYTYEKDGEPVADATKAGIYTVTISAAETANYEAAADKVVTLTITTTATVSLSNIIVAESTLATAEDYDTLRFPAEVSVAYGDDTTGTITPAWSKTLDELKALAVGEETTVALATSAFPTWVTAISGNELTFEVTDKFPVDVTVELAGTTYGTALEAPVANQTDAGNGTDDAATFSYKYTGMTAAEVAYDSEVAPTDAGNYTVTATLVSATHAGSASAAFTIAPLAIEAVIENAERKYGDADPNFTYTATGLIESDALDPEFSTTATATSDVGTYPITAVAGNKNYAVTWTNGELEIFAKPLEETAFVPVISGATGRGATLEFAVDGLAADNYTIAWSTGGTEATYTLVWADSNTDVTVAIAGTGNYTGSATSEPVAIPAYALEGSIGADVTNGAESDAAKLDIGDTVTINKDGIIPADAFDTLGATATYAWFLDGVAIEGATADSYTIVDGNVGVLSAKLTVGGNFTGEFEATVGEIGKAPLAGTITITETDGVLTADTTAVSGVAGTDYEVKWFRGEEEITAELVDGAYTVGTADYGMTITVKAVAIGDVYTGVVLETYNVPAIAPSDVAISTTARATSIAVTVNASENGAAITSYTITITDGAEFTDTYTGAENAYTFENLVTGTTYTITATATNAAGVSEAATVTAIAKSSAGRRPSSSTTTPVEPEQPEDPEDPEVPSTVVDIETEETSAKATADNLKDKETANFGTTTESGAAVKTTVDVKDSTADSITVTTTDSEEAAIGAAATEDAKAIKVEIEVKEGDAVAEDATAAKVAIKAEADTYAYIVDENGFAKRAEFTYDAEAGEVVLENVATGSVIVLSKSKPATFSDIAGHWAEDFINYAADAGIMNGVAEAIFAPEELATRGMINAMSARLAKAAALEVIDATDAKIDTDEAHWAFGTECTALANGWSNGLGTLEDGTVLMGTDNNVTRQQLVTMIYRFVKAEKSEGSLAAFADADKVADWAVDAMNWAVANGIVTGKSATTLDPEGNATRAEIATIYARVIAYIAK